MPNSPRAGAAPSPGFPSMGRALNSNGSIPQQIPAALSLPREREWVDDLGNYEWSEFTDYQSEAWPAAIYPVLAQSGTWSPAQGEPFLNPAASITAAANGSYVLQFGGLPYQPYVLQSASSITGPWTTVSGTVTAGVTGVVQFTNNPASAATFYRTQGQTQIY